MPKGGFSLIEILVVVAIMALVGIFTFSNYKSFGEDQNLKNAVLDIQSQLRTAQTNATTNLKCGTEYSAIWQVEFATDKKTVNLKCSTSADTQKELKLDTNIAIVTVAGADAGCPSDTPFTISFAPISGKITIVPVGANCTSLTVTLKNSKTETTKDLSIEKGGKIYAQ